MKKLIAILVVFALVMGAAFAEASVSGAVFGTVDLIKGTTGENKAGDAPDPTAGVGMNRIRIEAQGQDDDGVFGAWVRAEGGGFAGNAWWKPIDQFLMRIGSNGGDGFWGKEGVTGWGFYGMPSDVGIVRPGNVWGGGYFYSLSEDDVKGLETLFGEGNAPGVGVIYRDAFFGGIGSNALMLEIKPTEMIGINLGLLKNGTAEEFYANAIIQLDMNFDFGNIAVTFVSGRGHKDAEKGTVVGTKTDKYFDTDPDSATVGTVVTKVGDDVVGAKDEVNEPAKVYLYGGIPIGDNLSLDLGVGITFPYTNEAKLTVNTPVAIGAGLKVGITEQFGLKFRAVANVAGSMKADGGDAINMPTYVLADVLPYFALNDKMTVFCSIGLAVAIMPTDDDSKGVWLTNDDGDPVNNVGWHINPYITVGSEWGPKFLAGIQVWSYGEADQGYGKDGKGKAPLYFAVPIAIQASF